MDLTSQFIFLEFCFKVTEDLRIMVYLLNWMTTQYIALKESMIF